MATRAALASAAAGGAVPSSMATPPDVAVSLTSNISGENVTLVEDTGSRRSFGGRFYKLDIPSTNWAQWNSTHLSGPVDDGGFGGGVEFITQPANAELEVVYSGSAGAGCRIWVDGLLVSNYPFRLPVNDRHFVKLSFSSPASRRVRVEIMGGAVWQGIKLPVGQTISAPPEFPLKLVAAGDSFTEGSAAYLGGVSQYGLLGYVNFMRACLGVSDAWSSGSGGTGWAKTNGSRVNMKDRNQIDVIGPAPNVVVYAMGINDDDAAAALANAAFCLDQTRAALPAAMIYVLGPWDSWAPGAMAPTQQSIRDGLSSLCAGRGGVKFFDPTGVTFSKPAGDGTHPDRVGYETLGLWLANQIRVDLGLAPLAATRGPELVVNGDMGSATGWNLSFAGDGSKAATIANGILSIQRGAAGANRGLANQSVATINGQQYELLFYRDPTANGAYATIGGAGGTTAGINRSIVASASGASTGISFECPIDDGTTKIDDVSVRRILA